MSDNETSDRVSRFRLLALVHSASPDLKNVILSEQMQKRSVVYLRDADLKDVVLDQLLPQHDDAELNAQLNEAASWCTLRDTHTSFVHLFTVTLCFSYSAK